VEVILIKYLLVILNATDKLTSRLLIVDNIVTYLYIEDFRCSKLLSKAVAVSGIEEQKCRCAFVLQLNCTVTI